MAARCGRPHLVKLVEREEHAIARHILDNLALVELLEIAGLEELVSGYAPIGSRGTVESTLIKTLARELLRRLEVELIRDRRARAHLLFSKNRLSTAGQQRGERPALLRLRDDLPDPGV